jgi:hypothetical protein
VGGTPEMANIIAYNGGNGISVQTSADLYNKISCNSIHHNAGYGIDLYPPGPTPNDAGDGDTGPNMGMNYPEFTQIQYSSGTAIVYGTLDTPNPENCTVQLYKADDSPSAQGKTFLDSVIPDSNGAWTLVVNNISDSESLTCLAIDATGNTSEFSPAAPLGIFSLNSSEDGKIKVFPNPFDEFVKIEWKQEISDKIIIQLTDMYGKTVLTEAVESSRKGENIHTLNTDRLTQGIYCLVIISERQIRSSIIMVKITRK